MTATVAAVMSLALTISVFGVLSTLRSFKRTIDIQTEMIQQLHDRIRSLEMRP